MTTHRSFWQDIAGMPGQIRLQQTPSVVREDEILIKVAAWALNPADHMVQDIALPFITYPLILGEDVAGTVEKVGDSAASRFSVGDRVLAMALGAVNFKSEHGAFQEYVVLERSMACRIPDSLPFTDAAVLPLCISTAAHGLYSKDYLSLPYPKNNAVDMGQSILVWGGSSGVGANAIQLARASGFSVISTCSAHNIEFVKSIGANKVFDYNSRSTILDLAAEIENSNVFAIFHAAGDVDSSIQVSARSKTKPRIVSTVLVPEDSVPEGISAKWIYASSGEVPHTETCRATFDRFLPEALAAGTYKIAPPASLITTKGLDGIQEGLDLLRKGVSAKKLVIEA